MFIENIQPRFSDTDALGHINNTIIPVWFEGAREPIFKLFSPELDVHNWKLILAKIDVEFHAELFYGQPAEIKTWISRIGNSSFDVYQEVWQSGRRSASGTAVMVHFCHQEKRSKPIPDDIVAEMSAHMKEQPEP